MGEERWTASLRSVGGLVLAPIVAAPSTLSLLGGHGLSPLGLVFLVGAMAIAVSSAVLKLVVGSDGVAVRPGGPRLDWATIEGFDVGGTFQGTIRAYRHGVDKPILLNAQPMRPSTARALVERLNAELSAS